MFLQRRFQKSCLEREIIMIFYLKHTKGRVFSLISPLLSYFIEIYAMKTKFTTFWIFDKNI